MTGIFITDAPPPDIELREVATNEENRMMKKSNIKKLYQNIMPNQKVFL